MERSDQKFANPDRMARIDDRKAGIPRHRSSYVFGVLVLPVSERGRDASRRIFGSSRKDEPLDCDYNGNARKPLRGPFQLLGSGALRKAFPRAIR